MTIRAGSGGRAAAVVVCGALAAACAGEARPAAEACRARTDWNARLDRLLPGFAAGLFGRELQLSLALDTAEVIRTIVKTVQAEVYAYLEAKKIRYDELRIVNRAIHLRVRAPGDADVVIRERASSAVRGEKGPDGLVTLVPTEAFLERQVDAAVDDAIATLGCRIDRLRGVAPRRIVREGRDRIRVHVRGGADAPQLRDLLTRPARLGFHAVHAGMTAAQARQAQLPPGYVLMPTATGEEFLVAEVPYLDGTSLVEASVHGEAGRIGGVAYRLDAAGTRAFARVTAANVGRAIAIVLDERVISAPVIREPILGGHSVISGNFTAAEAAQLSILLQSGALPAPLRVLDVR